MRSKLICAFLAFGLVATSVQAEPPKPGTKGHIFVDKYMANGQLVLCDMQIQVEEIARARNPFAKFHEYHAILNEYQEPTCDARVWRVEEVLESDYLGELKFGPFQCHVWNVNVITKGFERWILYFEPVLDDNGNLVRYQDT